MISFMIENVRCFTNPPPVPLAPLTLLVGENSTGKSTFLASIRLAWDTINQFSTPDFNEEPFVLGGFNEVANYQGDQVRATSFSFGFSAPLRSSGESAASPHGENIAARMSFANCDSQPFLTSMWYGSGPFQLHYSLKTDGDLDNVVIDSISGRLTVPGYKSSIPIELIASPGMLRIYEKESKDGQTKPIGTWPAEDEWNLLDRLRWLARQVFPERPYAIAPVRTKPRRTHDLWADTPRPEGGHIPSVLAKSFRSNAQDCKKLKQTLDEFGQASGLFSTLDVKRFGSSEGDPFQIRLAFGGPDFNLVDAGYGVSQMLPIVVDAVRAPAGSTVLIQQPEVHLHPRAQAALGSLLLRLAKAEDKRFIVETHSDYLVDRARMEVRDGGGVTPEDVQIVYFDRKDGSTVDICPLELDDHGNLIDTPAGYRDFFLREEQRFLGI